MRHPDDLIRLVEGDVLVAIATTTAFNAVFPLLAGGRDRAGRAVQPRRDPFAGTRVPAVVGVAECSTSVRDGDVIEVDPLAGAVRVVEPAS